MTAAAEDRSAGRRRLGAPALGWLGFYALVLSAWAAVFAMDPATRLPDGVEALGAAYWRDLCAASARDARLPGLVAMWAAMSAAMMAPTAVPALRTFRDLTRAGAGGEREFAALLGGYLAVWLGFSGLAALAQAGLSGLGLVDGAGRSAALWLNAALLLAAGLYQFSPIKEACLSKCRAPLTFFMERWRPGPRAAARMGMDLGVACLGCCWALMLLAFVGGTMSLVWMAAGTLLMTLEKLPELGRPITRPLGFALIGASAAMAAGAVWT